MSQWNSYLEHFGIFGMKWGIRRFQNEDGTLTEEGKKRYSHKDIEEGVDETLKQNTDVSSRIVKNGAIITKKSEDLANKYNKAFSNARFTEKQKEQLWKELYEDFGVGVDDDELFDMVVEDRARKFMEANIPQSIKKERAAFEKLMNQYFDDIHSVADQVVKKYENAVITDAPSMYGQDNKSIIGHIVSDKLNSSYNAYVSRHFDDFIYDDDYYNGLYKATKEFTAENYNKRFGKS